MWLSNWNLDEDEPDNRHRGTYSGWQLKSETHHLRKALVKWNEHHSRLKIIDKIHCKTCWKQKISLRLDFPDGMTIIPGMNCFRRRLLKPNDKIQYFRSICMYYLLFSLKNIIKCIFIFFHGHCWRIRSITFYLSILIARVMTSRDYHSTTTN